MHGCQLLRTSPSLHPPDLHPDAEPQHAPLKRKRTLLQPPEPSRASSPSTPMPAERAAQAQVQELKAELAKARADAAAAAVALAAAEREPRGLGGTVDRLFSSRTCAPGHVCFVRMGIWLTSWRLFCRLRRACGAAPSRRVPCEP